MTTPRDPDNGDRPERSRPAHGASGARQGRPSGDRPSGARGKPAGPRGSGTSGSGGAGARKPSGSSGTNSSGARKPAGSGGGANSGGYDPGGARKPPSAAGRPAASGRENRTRTGDGAEREWTYDPRREARRQMARVALPDDVDPRDLDSETRRQLMSLAKDTAELVGKHLVMAGRLMDDEPVQALAHARAARALAGRLGVVREANGLVAYTAGEWTEALSELRAARRMTGQPDHLAVMADCERALGNPDRALLVTQDPQAKDLDPATKVELMIVASGARRDLGQAGTAVALLQVPALEGPVRPWTGRLRYAYADALLDAGREEEARTWFARAAEADPQGETDAEDRLLELDGVVFVDLAGDDDEDDDEVAGDVDAVDVAPDVSADRPLVRQDQEIPALDLARRAASSHPGPDSPVAPSQDQDQDQDELRLFD